MTSLATPLRSNAPWRVVDGFGRAVQAAARYARPESVDELASLFARANSEGLQVTLRGAGRSYGDASLSSNGGLVIDATALDKVIKWDPMAGVIEAQGGLTIEGLWRRILEDGYWPAVVPGTMRPTLAGCLSMNVHGKNNFAVGPFGDHVKSFDLLTPQGEIIRCSPTENEDLFRGVISGAGLLGAITRVELKVKHVESGMLKVEAITLPSLDKMFDAFEERLDIADYLVGWVDCLSTGKSLGRGEVHRANYISADEDPFGRESFHVERQTLPSTILGFPKSMLWRFMAPFANNLGTKLVNTAKYWAGWAKSGSTYLQSHVGFAFLLDYVPNWRLMYGRHGFIQYQVFVPDEHARRVFKEILRDCQAAGMPSYLGVMKRHRPDKFLLTHAVDGWSMAMDFKVKTGEREALWALLHRVSDKVLDAGGRFYFAKDAILRPEHVARSWNQGQREVFKTLKARLDPNNVLASDLGRRVGLLEAGGA